jgi:hypothetical protein
VSVKIFHCTYLPFFEVLLGLHSERVHLFHLLLVVLWMISFSFVRVIKPRYKTSEPNVKFFLVVHVSIITLIMRDMSNYDYAKTKYTTHTHTQHNYHQNIGMDLLGTHFRSSSMQRTNMYIKNTEGADKRCHMS